MTSVAGISSFVMKRAPGFPGARFVLVVTGLRFALALQRQNAKDAKVRQRSLRFVLGSAVMVAIYL